VKTFAVVVSLLVVAGSAHGASMFKCVDAKGQVSYSDHPCAESSKEAWSSRLGTRSKSPRQIERPARVESVKEAGKTAGTARSSEAARIDALRVEEMTRILGQQPD
jgi:hypothetical protein